MRFVHTGDLHLGKMFSETRYGKQFAARRRRELLDTFSRLVDFANRNQVDLILVCGDFLNSEQLRTEELRNINAIIERLDRAVILAVSGNHDPQTENSAYQRIEWSRRLCLAPPGISRISLAPLGACITCHSWDRKELPGPFSIPQPSGQGGECRILMLHADAVSSDSRYLPVDAAALSGAGFDYVALGHIHKPAQLFPNVRYAGSLEPLDFGEEGAHGFWLVDTGDGRVDAQFVPFAAREYRTLAVQTTAQDAEVAIAGRIAAAIQREGGRHIFTVRLCGVHPTGAGWDIQRIQDQLRQQEFFCWLQDETAPDYDLQQLRTENGGNLIGDFIDSFQGETMDRLHRRALELGLEALIRQKRGES